MISPHFAKLEEKHKNVKFVKVDVEEQEVSVASLVLGALCALSPISDLRSPRRIWKTHRDEEEGWRLRNS